MVTLFKTYSRQIIEINEERKVRLVGPYYTVGFIVLIHVTIMCEFFVFMFVVSYEQ